MAVNLAEMAFASWLAAEETARQEAVITTRNYYEGDQDTFLTDRLKEFLNATDDNEFNLNICRTVVDAVAERMIISGVDTTESGDVQPLNEWANAVWEYNRLDLLYESAHEGVLRDGEYFVMVDWDDDAKMPRMTLHPRYTDATVGGDNFGCKAHYPDDDTNQSMLCLSKRWIEDLGAGKTRNRMTLYYPDKIEKYEWRGDWIAYSEEDGGQWPIPFRDISGKPLGIIGLHFRNTPDLRSELWDAIPMQKAINKALIDLLAAGDMTGFQIFVALGWIPTTDGEPLKSDSSNMATLGPGQLIGTTRTPSEASFQAVPPGDLRPLIDLMQSLIGWLAVITSTPESRLSFTRQIAAEGTLKEQNEGLFAKVRRRRKMVDATWKDAFEMARKLANVYGAAGLPDNETVFLQWEPVQSRDTEDERQEWQVKKEMGVPLETIWAEMGYSQEQIEGMKETEEYQARMTLQAALMGSEDG